MPGGVEISEDNSPQKWRKNPTVNTTHLAPLGYDILEFRSKAKADLGFFCFGKSLSFSKFLSVESRSKPQRVGRGWSCVKSWSRPLGQIFQKLLPP